MEVKDFEQVLHAQLGDQFDVITLLEQIDSTNAEAIRRMQALQETSQLIVGLSQSAGRGRRGRQWMSPRGAGLYISFTRAFAQPLAELQGLSLITALSVAEAITELGVSNVQLKWPNDVLVGRKKLAGILLETCQNGRQPVIVFGIGINLDLPDSAVAQIDRPVTDVRRELGTQFNERTAPDLLVAFCQNIHLKLAEFLESGFAQFRDSWNAIDAYLLDNVVIINGDQQSRGVYQGVDDAGALMLLDDVRGLREIKGGEVFPSMRSAEEYSSDAIAGLQGSSSDSSEHEA